MAKDNQQMPPKWNDTDSGFSGKDFKVAAIKMLEQAITSIPETKLK